MQSDYTQLIHQPGRYINSVSDLFYSTDEIEFLLDDIRDLEPHNCRPEDIQDFEIAGSRTGAASTNDVDCSGGGDGDCCDSPIDTVNSWDSHSHYRRRPHSPDPSLYSGVIVYCDHKHLSTPTGIVRLLLLVTSIACLACLCTSGTVQVGLFMLPLAGRLRYMLFVTLLGLMVTSLLLFLDITHIVYLFPFNWGKVNAYIYVSLSILFLIGSSLIFHTIFLATAFEWVPKWTHHQLLITGCLGYLCCFQCGIIAIVQKCITDSYRPVIEDPSLNLQERIDTTLIDDEYVDNTSNYRLANQTTTTTTITHNYKQLVNYTHVVASTSRQDNYIIDDGVQPCSSKSSDPYRLA